MTTTIEQTKPPTRLINSKQLAELLQCTERTLEDLRLRDGMPFYRVGHRSARYDVAEVMLWIRERFHVFNVGKQCMRAPRKKPQAKAQAITTVTE